MFGTVRAMTAHAMDVPLLRLGFGEEETALLGEVLRSGMLIQGPRVAAFEDAVRARTGRKHAIAVSNGTAALELALEVLGVGPGDEVIVPNVTWPSAGNAALRRGATVVLVDVDAHEWNARPEVFAAARTARTKAAVAIDQFGSPARMPEIVAALPGVAVIEDAACAIGSTLGGRAAGSFGAVACLSFHPRKVVTTGEGGMCLTDDDAMAERLRTLRNHGQRTPTNFTEAGPNERLPELSAALGTLQLGRLDAMLEARRAQARRYASELPMLAFQQTAPGAMTNHQTLGALLPEGTTAAARDAFLDRLRALGIGTGFLSYALHRLPQFGPAADSARAARRAFPNSESVVDRGFALPCFPGLTDIEQAHVVASVRRALDGIDSP